MPASPPEAGGLRETGEKRQRERERERERESDYFGIRVRG